ncbi:hypothetical protein [uncultured Hymenobacter sp.]
MTRLGPVDEIINGAMPTALAHAPGSEYRCRSTDEVLKNSLSST